MSCSDREQPSPKVSALGVQYGHRLIYSEALQVFLTFSLSFRRRVRYDVAALRKLPLLTLLKAAVVAGAASAATVDVYISLVLTWAFHTKKTGFRR